MYDFSKLLTASVFLLSCERSHIGVWSESRNSREKGKNERNLNNNTGLEKLLWNRRGPRSRCLCTGAVELRTPAARRNLPGNPPSHSVRSKITPGLVSMMTGALQACNCSVLSLDQLRPTLQDVEHRHLRILSNDLRGWNGCRGGAGTRAEMFVLEEGTERTLYVASGCDSFPSTVPLTLALTHLTWKGVQGLMTLAVAIIANKGAGKKPACLSCRIGFPHCHQLISHN